MDIFSALKKAFSTGMIIQHVGGREVRVIDTQRSQAYTRRNNDHISKLRKGLIYNTSLSQNYIINRLALYRDYDMMDTDPIVSAILDVYVFEAFTKNEMGQILNIKSDNEQVYQILHELFYDRLHCEYNFGIWFRSFLKYGDFFLALKLSQELGVYGSSPISTYDIERIQDDDSDSYSYRLSSMGGQQVQNYNIAHFRLLVDPNFLPYGRSILQPARRIWKNFNLMVDAMLIQRIMRAPERRIFKIDVGDIPQQQVNLYMTDIINKMKKVPYRDPNSGQLNLRYNMMNLLEDYYIPVRGNTDGSNIDTLQGMENSFTQDIQFVKSYMMAAFKVPKAFVTFEQGIQSKATLSQLDIIFGRAVEQYQNIFTNELYRIALIHLFMMGYTDVDSLDFKLQLNNPSIVKQLQDIDLWSQKVDLGQRMKDTQQFSLSYIYKHIYRMSDDDVKRERLQIIKDKIFQARKQALTPQQAEDIIKLQKDILKLYNQQDEIDAILDNVDSQINQQQGQQNDSQTPTDNQDSYQQDTPKKVKLIKKSTSDQQQSGNQQQQSDEQQPDNQSSDQQTESEGYKINPFEQQQMQYDQQGNPIKKKVKIKKRPKSSKHIPDTELKSQNLDVQNSPLTVKSKGGSALGIK